MVNQSSYRPNRSGFRTIVDDRAGWSRGDASTQAFERAITASIDDTLRAPVRQAATWFRRSTRDTTAPNKQGVIATSPGGRSALLQLSRSAPSFRAPLSRPGETRSAMCWATTSCERPSRPSQCRSRVFGSSSSLANGRVPTRDRQINGLRPSMCRRFYSGPSCRGRDVGARLAITAPANDTGLASGRACLYHWRLSQPVTIADDTLCLRDGSAFSRSFLTSSS